MEITIIPPKNYFCYTEKTILNKMHEFTDKEVDALFSESGKLQLERQGPLEFIYLDCSNDRNKTFTLSIALPVRETPAKIPARYSINHLEGFKCVKHTHKGSLANLENVYAALFGEVFKAGKKPTNQIREVYHKFVDMDSPENITEIQIGIE